MRVRAFVIALSAAFTLSGCGTLTGIPSHGGGKRFAVEQEMISAASRAAAKDLDLSPLIGKKVYAAIIVIGDEGSGTLMGGRYTLDALVRGDYINSPTTTTVSQFPVVPTTAITESGGTTTTTTAQSALNAPSQSESETRGHNKTSGVGVRAGGQGEYRNETLTTNPRDVTYLNFLLQTIFFLRGIQVVPPAEADTDVFIIVDVFGTIRSRTEWAVSNQERLIATTKLEAFAVDRKTNALVMSPRTSSFEAKYEEQFAMWVGPFKTSKTFGPSAPLLVDFSDVTKYPGAVNTTMSTPPQVAPPASSAEPSVIEQAIKRERR